MSKKFKYVVIYIILIIFCSSCAYEHTHRFKDGKCDCGESDPDYKEVLYTITFVNYDGSVIDKMA